MIPQLGENEAEILEQVHLTLSMYVILIFLPTILAPGPGKQTNKQFLTWSLTSVHQPRFQVEAPQLLLPTMSDSDNVKPGGLTETVLTEKVVLPLFFGRFHHFAFVLTFRA